MQKIGDIQSLLVVLMCNIVNVYFSRRSSEIGVPEENEKDQKGFFVDAAIAFFKLQQLIPNIPVKTQVIHFALIVLSCCMVYILFLGRYLTIILVVD